MRAIHLGLALLAGASLAACGGSSGGDEHEHTYIESEGRLAVLQDGSPAVRIYDLDDKSVVQTLTVNSPPSAVYASPGGRYALALQRTADTVQVIDGGIWQEDHVDHLHDYKEAPKLLPMTIAGVRPTHYETHDGLAAIFMDGLGDSGQKAGVRVLSDASLGKGELEAALELPTHMHGTAEPRGQFLLTTHRDPAATDTLPVQVELHRRNGSGYDFVMRFEETCPGLHGSYSNEGHTAFGCSDGVLVVSQAGEEFTAKKVMNLPDMEPGVRIGTLAGHHEYAGFVGIASPGHLFEIDPVAGTMTRIAWAADRTRRAHAFDAEGANFLVLDDLGVVHVLDVAGEWAVRSSVPVVSTMPAAAPFPSIAVSGAADKAFVSDPVGRGIAVLDLEQLSVSERLALDFSPTGLAWVGIAGHHEH